MGSVNMIVRTLTERPYGKFEFKASKLMKEAILISGLLTNSESWIIITKTDLKQLEKPDIILQRNILSTSGNPSNCFMQLELVLIPVNYVIMQKSMKFLHYIM